MAGKAHRQREGQIHTYAHGDITTKHDERRQEGQTERSNAQNETWWGKCRGNECGENKW